MGSINKVFTRLAIERLAAEGRLALTDTLDEHVPEYPVDKGSRITLQQLLDFRSGNGDFFGPAYQAADPSRLRTLQDYLPLFADTPLEFEPGTKERYSNAGYVLLGLVIEKVTGKSYYDHVRETVFLPLGMTSTGSYAVDEGVPGIATGYTSRGGPSRPNHESLPARGSSAGGGYSTLDDLKRYADALRSGKLGPAAGGMGVAGGAPGINAVLEVDDTLTLVVLANLDPPAAMNVAETVRGWMADGTGRQVERSGGVSR